MRGASKKICLVPHLITDIITRNNHLYILKKNTSKYIYNLNHLVHWKRTDNVTLSPEVIEFMIDHSNHDIHNLISFSIL